MIREPYIGMPLTMGAYCNIPGQPQNPSAPQPPTTPPAEEIPGGGTTPDPMPPQTPGAGFDSRYLGSLPIASAYVPMQQWKTTYSDTVALQRGTLFPELDLPFEGRTILTERGQGGRRR